MARKALRNLALLGGLGAAAYMMGKKTGEETEKKDLTRDFKDTDTDVKVEPKKDMPVAKPVAKPVATKPSITTPAASAGRSDKEYGETKTMEGRTASGMPREARGVMDTRTPTKKFADRQESAADKVIRARREQLGLKAGGSVSKRADGCAIKGKTRGRVI